MKISEWIVFWVLLGLSVISGVGMIISAIKDKSGIALACASCAGNLFAITFIYWLTEL